MHRRMLLSAFLVAGAIILSFAQTPLEMTGVRAGLDRSPGDYVAGVFRHVGRVDCRELQDGLMRCWSRVVVVDEIASRPASKAPRIELKVMTKAERGRQLQSRFIAFLVPLEGTDLYAGTFMTPYDESKHKRFRELIETAVGGAQRL